jgi:putative SOS response-associated peptidase YedK
MPSASDVAQIDGKAALAEAMVRAVTALEHYPVSPRVNNAKNQGADLIEPFPNRA